MPVGFNASGGAIWELLVGSVFCRRSPWYSPAALPIPRCTAGQTAMARSILATGLMPRQHRARRRCVFPAQIWPTDLKPLPRRPPPVVRATTPLRQRFLRKQRKSPSPNRPPNGALPRNGKTAVRRNGRRFEPARNALPHAANTSAGVAEETTPVVCSATTCRCPGADSLYQPLVKMVP